MEKKKIVLTDILLCGASLLFLAGQFFLFHACGPHDDGSWMTCHWADVTVRGLAAVLLILAAGHAGFSSPQAKAALSFAMIPVAVLAGTVPGGLIDLCMMDSMRCRSVMRPADIAFACLIVLLAVLDIVLQRRKTHEV